MGAADRAPDRLRRACTASRTRTAFCAAGRGGGGRALPLPGDVYDEPGHVRLGFGRKTLPEALDVLERWLADGSG